MEIQDRLADIIKREKDRLGSYQALADQIRSINHNANASAAAGQPLRVDRRKLSSIVEKKDVSLNVSELQALDTYLAQTGKQGLKIVFEKPTLIRALTDTKLVHFLIGAKPQTDKTVSLSRWDVRSMISVIHGIHSISTAVVIDIHDVLLKPSVSRPSTQVKNKEVQALLEDRRGPSILCIGSPRACHASELMLAKMFGIAPFKRVSASSARDLPFYFVWSDDQYESLPSSFALRTSDVLPGGPSNKGWKSVALKTTDPDKVYSVDRSTKLWRNYGVVVAQRRQSGRLWIVAAGLSGPSTLAVARSLLSISDQLLLENRGQRSPVVWAVVEATVKREPSARHAGENRKLTGEKIVLSPRKW